MKKGIILMPYVSGNGGTETVVRNFLKSFKDDKDIKIDLLSIGGTSNFDWLEGLNYNMVSISKSYSINENKFIRNTFYVSVLPFSLFKFIKKNKPDFIISTNPFMWYLSKQIVKLLRINTKIVAWYHYSLEQHPVKQKYLKSADYYFAISSGIKAQLERKGIIAQKIFLIYNPIISNKQIIPRPKNYAKFLYIGRLMLDGQKNVKELFNALHGLKGKWSLDIYGNVYGKIENEQKIKSYTKEIGIFNNIKWHGFVDDPWNNIDEATALILTSKFEGLPMVLCEAISHGIYCISSDVDTGPSDIINNENGALYQLGNIKQLRNYLQGLVDNPSLPKDSNTIVKTSEKFMLPLYKRRVKKYILSIL